MKPLAGCRVLDLGIITAGAATSALLADLGAEVIKVESPTFQDPFRIWSSGPPAASAGELPPFYRMTNRNKASISLDLKAPDGRAAFLRLAANSDVVVENFSRGVLARLGIDYAALRAARPEIILASISSQGETGPDARHVSFGSTLEALAGMAWRTGYGDGVPVVTGLELNYPDQVVPLFAAGMVAVAWHARRNGGGGAHLDLSQRELTSFLSGEAFVTGTGPAGNAQPSYAVQDCVRCAGDTWIAVSVRDADLPALAAMLGAVPGAGADAGLLADALAAWAAGRDAADCTAALAALGIAAAPVLQAHDVLLREGTDWRWAMLRDAEGGLVKGFPFQLDPPLTIDRPARHLGADTVEVLRRVGGFSDAEIGALLASGAAGTVAPPPDQGAPA